MENIMKYNNFLKESITINNSFYSKDSTPITNNKDILEWLVNNSLESYENKQKNLSQSLILELTDLFGPPTKKLRLEFLTSLWCLNFKDVTFNVFTAKGKGTNIEICNYDYKDINKGVRKDIILEFLKELHTLINQ